MISFGGSSSSSSPVRVSNWNKQQKDLFAALSPMLMKGLGKVPSYPRQMYVPETEAETRYLQRAPSIASELAEARSRLKDPAYQITPETTEQYYQDAVKAPAMREWEQTVKPTIKESFAGPGYWSSARAEAEQEGAESLATELGRQRAELYYADEMARRQALTDAATRDAQFSTDMAAQEAAQLGTAGQYERGIAQEKVLADLQRWLSGETVDGVKPAQYNPFMQLVFQALGLTPFSVGQSQQSTGVNFGLLG